MNTKDAMRDWADIRMFLAIVDHGTLVAAAEHLDLTQPTLGRRLSALQKRLGVTLFVRSGRRLALTDAGNAILENARRMETEMLAIERTVDVQSSGLSGVVTISATEGTGTEYLAPEMMDFHRRYPDIVLDIQIENRSVDLVHREADIALRLAEPNQPDLIAKRLLTIGFGLYASKAYLSQHKPIRNRDDLSGHNFVALNTNNTNAALAPFRELEVCPDARIVVLTNSPTAQLSAVLAGYGISSISHRWASRYADLQPVLPDVTVAKTDMWIVTHEELRHSARIRAVFDYLSERLRSAESLFATGHA